MIWGDAVRMRNGRPMPNRFATMQAGNLYVFGVNNPVMWADPSGRFIVRAAVVAAAASVARAVSSVSRTTSTPATRPSGGSNQGSGSSSSGSSITQVTQVASAGGGATTSAAGMGMSALKPLAPAAGEVLRNVGTRIAAGAVGVLGGLWLSNQVDVSSTVTAPATRNA
jgi:hypothetical protein